MITTTEKIQILKTRYSDLIDHLSLESYLRHPDNSAQKTDKQVQLCVDLLEEILMKIRDE